VIDVAVRRGADNIVGSPGALHPAVRAALEQMAGQPALETLTPDQARRLPQPLDPAPEAVAAILQRSVPGPRGPIAIRSYRPAVEHPASLVYAHGGGFVIGGLDASDAFCRRLANATACTVSSVEYRLAPEHKFPAGLEDVYTAVGWVAERASPGPLVVAGTSAGANLVAGATLLARERGGPAVAMQVLVVPAMRFAAATESHRAYGTGYGLDSATMEWFARQYLSSEDEADDPLVSPVLADLRGMPPALVLTAEFDCLRDDGELYARRLRDAGGEATVIRYAGAIHGFVGLPDVPAARLAAEHIGTIVRALLAELA